MLEMVLGGGGLEEPDKGLKGLSEVGSQLVALTSRTRADLRPEGKLVEVGFGSSTKNLCICEKHLAVERGCCGTRKAVGLQRL